MTVKTSQLFWSIVVAAIAALWPVRPADALPWESSVHASDSGAAATQDSIKIRFTVVSNGAERQWTGLLEKLSDDSIFVRVVGVDTLVPFARNDLRTLERWHRAVSRGRGAKIGCLVVGASLGVLTLLATTGSELKGLTFVGLVVGCGVGALGGVIAGAGSREWWGPFELPAPGRAGSTVRVHRLTRLDREDPPRRHET